MTTYRKHAAVSEAPHTPLAGDQSYGRPSLQEGLGNIPQLSPREKGRWVWGESPQTPFFFFPNPLSLTFLLSPHLSPLSKPSSFFIWSISSCFHPCLPTVLINLSDVQTKTDHIICFPRILHWFLIFTRVKIRVLNIGLQGLTQSVPHTAFLSDFIFYYFFATLTLLFSNTDDTIYLRPFALPEIHFSGQLWDYLSPTSNLCSIVTFSMSPYSTSFEISAPSHNLCLFSKALLNSVV